MIPAISNNTTPSGSEPNLAAMPMETIEQALEVFFEIGQQVGEITLAGRALKNKDTRDIPLSELFPVLHKMTDVIEIQHRLFIAHPRIDVEQIINDFIKKKLA